MPSALTSLVIGFQGGFQTDLPDQARQQTYFTKAENVIFEVDGAVRKVGGTIPVNQTVLSGTPKVTGAIDFWYGGGAASFVQNFVVVTSAGEVYKDNLDGSAFVNITGTTSIGINPTPVFCVARDTLTIWFSNNAAPVKYTGSGNIAALGGSPPAGRGAVYHVGRMWAWGANANASRLYYSSISSIEDWSGADTGAIDIDADDGDRIIGAVSFRNTLIVFKGPNKGSIHVISGTAPTGGDAFSRTLLTKGIPLQSHNSIIQVGNDVLFMSSRGIHSLSGVQQFGNFSTKDETRYLKRFFREEVNLSRLDQVWAVDYAQKSCVLWALPSAGSVDNDKVLGLSYIRQEEEGFKPFTWNRSCVSAAIRRNPSTDLDEVVFGTNTGIVYRQDTPDRSISAFDGTGFQLDLDQLDADNLGGLYASQAYTMRLQLPQLLLAQQDSVQQPRGDQPFNLVHMYMRSQSVGNHDVHVTLTRDNKESEEYTFNQGQSGFVLGVSRLDVDTLGGVRMRLAYSDPPVVGEARAIQLDITQGGINEDCSLLELGFEIKPAAQSTIDV